jgi:hypothetical protein
MRQDIVDDKLSVLWHEIEKERKEDIQENRQQNEILERFNRKQISLREVDDEEALYFLFSDSREPNEFLQNLTEVQKKILFGYMEKLLQRRNSLLSERMESLLKTKEELNRRV